VSHHNADERMLYHAGKTARWLCENDEQDAAYVVLKTAVKAYEPNDD
jgi:hypothetical protein